MYIKSEKEILNLIDKYFVNKTEHLILGRGDDCAELELKTPYLALSTDLFLEDIHFRKLYFKPEEIGHKALAVNLSDLAASGATPLGFALNLMLPKKTKYLELEQIFIGMSRLANAYNIALCGGDLSLSDKLGFGLTIWGDNKQITNEKTTFFRRNQAQEGDYIFITGNFGLARLALNKLEFEVKKTKKIKKSLLEPYFFELRQQLSEQIPKAMQAHLIPDPQIKISQALMNFKLNNNNNCRLSLMDLSDGILADLPRLLNSQEKNLGAKLNINDNMLDSELNFWEDNNSIPLKKQSSITPNMSYQLLQSIYGGEDYVLLGSCEEKYWQGLKQLLPQAQELGRVIKKNELIINDNKLSLKGFDHFK